MGIDICLVGDVSKGFLGKRNPEGTLEQIKAWFGKRGSPLIVWGRYLTENGIAVQLHPAADPVRFEIHGGQIVFEARTNTVGPGYHAALIDMALNIEKATDLQWDRSSKSVDEGDYFTTKDFHRLKVNFAPWLHTLCKAILGQDRDGVNGSLICIPSNLKITVPGYIFTPTGPREKVWVEAVANGSSSGDDFFAWPEEGHTLGYWIGLALSLMWLEITWQEPGSDRDRHLMNTAHLSLGVVFENDPTNPRIPWKAWKELVDLLGLELPAAAPSPLPDGEPIGYLREAP
jgi:hypothetical protein